MLSQPQTRTPVNSCEYFYLITSCEEFNQNLEEHSWSYGISLRSTDLSKILADVTHVLTSVIGKCVAIDVYLSSQGTTNSTQYSLFYNCFFTNWWVLCNWHVWSSQRLRHLIHFVGSLSVGPRLSVQLS